MKPVAPVRSSDAPDSFLNSVAQARTMLSRSSRMTGSGPSVVIGAYLPLAGRARRGRVAAIARSCGLVDLSGDIVQHRSVDARERPDPERAVHDLVGHGQVADDPKRHTRVGGLAGQ